MSRGIHFEKLAGILENGGILGVPMMIMNIDGMKSSCTATLQTLRKPATVQ